MKPCIIFLLSFCWCAGALAQQKKEPSLKKMQQERSKLAVYLDSLKDQAVTYSIELDSLNAIIELVSKQAEALQKNNGNDSTKGTLDSLNRQVALLRNQLAIPAKKFDRILFRLDSCVSAMNNLDSKIKGLQRTD